MQLAHTPPHGVAKPLNHKGLHARSPQLRRVCVPNVAQNNGNAPNVVFPAQSIRAECLPHLGHIIWKFQSIRQQAPILAYF